MISPQYYQPHFFWDSQKNSGTAITRQDQVQIHEELNLNIQCAMTTSFLRRDYQLKDNRMLPLGWTRTGPLQADRTPYIPADYLHETFPVAVGGDPSYADGSGTNVVRYEVPVSAFAAKNVTITATLVPVDPALLPARSLFAGAELSGHATALLPDVEPTDERDSDRKLEIPNNNGEPGG